MLLGQAQESGAQVTQTDNMGETGTGTILAVHTATQQQTGTQDNPDQARDGMGGAHADPPGADQI